MIYKSKYMTCVALIAPQKLRKLATLTTAVVVPDHITIEPIHSDKINCAKNTILLTMAMSVPRPRTSVPIIPSPTSLISNCKNPILNICMQFFLLKYRFTCMIMGHQQIRHCEQRRIHHTSCPAEDNHAHPSSRQSHQGHANAVEQKTADINVPSTI